MVVTVGGAGVVVVELVGFVFSMLASACNAGPRTMRGDSLHVEHS